MTGRDDNWIGNGIPACIYGKNKMPDGFGRFIVGINLILQILVCFFDSQLQIHIVIGNQMVYTVIWRNIHDNFWYDKRIM